MSETINRVKDCIGREWHVTEQAVREDYIGFLMQADDLSRSDAELAADSEEGKNAWGLDGYWFAEQIADSPSHVMAIGTLTKDICQEEKQKIVDRAARRDHVEILE